MTRPIINDWTEIGIIPTPSNDSTHTTPIYARSALGEQLHDIFLDMIKDVDLDHRYQALCDAADYYTLEINNLMYIRNEDLLFALKTLVHATICEMRYQDLYTLTSKTANNFISEIFSMKGTDNETVTN